MHNVSVLSKLSFVKNPLMHDPLFCNAWMSASSTQRNQLQSMVDKQNKYLNSFGYRLRTCAKKGGMVGVIIGWLIVFLMVASGNIHSVGEFLGGLIGSGLVFGFWGTVIGSLLSFNKR